MSEKNTTRTLLGHPKEEWLEVIPLREYAEIEREHEQWKEHNDE